MSVTEWLLDSDPSIRWQVMRDLTGDPAETYSAERSRIATEGWGAQLLSYPNERGQWGTNLIPASARPSDGSLPDVATRKLLRELHRVALDDLAGYLGVEAETLAAWEEGRDDPEDERFSRYEGFIEWSWNLGTYNPKWISTTYTLLLLRDMGLDPASEQARQAIALVRDNSKWDHDGQAFFDGEVEPCVNGMAVAIGSYFGENVEGIVDRLLTERMSDGGWNCEAENGSVRSSFDSTICVLEGLLEYERANRKPPAVTEARAGAQEYLLERGLFRRLSTGDVVDPAYLQFSFPPRWHYDVLRGLDYFRDAESTPDDRLADAIDLVESKRDARGRWPQENTYPGHVYFDMDDGDGQPSRWNTLRAMRVLNWAGRDI